MEKLRNAGAPARSTDSSRSRLAGFATALLVAAVFLLLGVLLGSRFYQMERAGVLLDASTVRAALEASINVRANLERGLVAFFEADPNRSEEEFRAYASALILDDPTVINLAMLKGTVIAFVHPYERNKAALGRDLSLIPEQARSVIEAIQTRLPVISGPYQLVQGGYGLTSRMSVYPKSDGVASYWGQASVVFDIDELFRQAGLVDHPTIEFAISRHDPRLERDTMIFGGEAVLHNRPVDLDIDIPGVAWVLSAVPKAGWRSGEWVVFGVGVGGAVVGLLAGLMMFSLLHTREALREMAYHDQLTDLPNRSLFWDRLGVATSRSERDGTGICLCMVDLNDFKLINDNYGHVAGDRLLVVIAKRLAGSLRKSDTVARLGGDEFAVIAPVADSSGVDEVTERLRACFKEPFDLGAVTTEARASFGSALYPVDGTDPEGLLAAADRRMYQEKRASK